MAEKWQRPTGNVCNAHHIYEKMRSGCYADLPTEKPTVRNRPLSAAKRDYVPYDEWHQVPGQIAKFADILRRGIR